MKTLFSSPEATRAVLAQAIETDQLVLHWQPTVCLETGHPAGFEALVRWRHPERGLLGPAELVPACEATGLVVPLGSWILRRAFAQEAGWRERFHDGDLQVAVNLSEEHLFDPQFLSELDRLAGETGVRPGALVFELRESVLVDAPRSMALLWQLRRRGYRIHIDDFGTGYTSLRELHRSPVEGLKIDRSFVARMKPGGEDCEVVRAACALAGAFDLAAVAEGVENPDQLRQVRSLGATHAQGYLFSRPLPSAEATSWLAAAPRW